jgi:hypothetical protein
MNIVYKISLYVLVVTSCFSWQQVAAIKTSANPAGSARKSYENLLSINILTNKKKKFDELQYLGALLVRNASERILKLCHGVDNITKAVKENMRGIEEIIARTPKGIAESVHEAYTWASGTIDRSGLFGENFQAKMLLDDNLMYSYASGTDETGAQRILKLQQKKAFLNYELEILNERYAPIIKAITSKLKKQTTLPADISSLKDLYENVN